MKSWKWIAERKRLKVLLTAANETDMTRSKSDIMQNHGKFSVVYSVTKGYYCAGYESVNCHSMQWFKKSIPSKAKSWVWLQNFLWGTWIVRSSCTMTSSWRCKRNTLPQFLTVSERPKYCRWAWRFQRRVIIRCTYHFCRSVASTCIRILEILGNGRSEWSLRIQRT